MGNLLSVGLGLVVIGIGLGIGNIGRSALDAMARQPEMAGKIQAAMLIAAGMVEGAGLFAIVIAFIS
jgi:F-type H+-transporting ATPase subunit c